MPRQLKIPSKIGEGRVGRVFISYKREELHAAKRLYEYLKERDFDVFWDDDIQCGQQWNELLDKELSSAACVVVLWSPMAMKSPWVKHEASGAIARGTYAPAWIELCPIEPPYGRAQAKDISDWDGKNDHQGFKGLMDAICLLVPVQQPLKVRLRKWFLANSKLIVSVLFSAVAFSLLVWQTVTVRDQLTELKSVSRTIDRVDTSRISADVSMTFDINDNAFDGYRDRLLAAFNLQKGELVASGRSLYEVDQTSLLFLNESLGYRFTILPGSELWPSPDAREEEKADQLLNTMALAFFVDRERTEDEFIALGSSPLSLIVAGRLDGREVYGVSQCRGSRLAYNSQDNTVSISVENTPLKGESFNRGFISRQDFLGAEISATMTGPAVPKGVEVHLGFSEGDGVQAVKGSRLQRLSDGTHEFRGKLGRHYSLDPDSPPVQ